MLFRSKLDNIAAGDAEYVQTLADFYTPFHAHVESKEDIEKITNLGDADPKFSCPKCKKPMVIKLGRNGKFLSCGAYPNCDGALTLEGKELGGDGEPLGNHPETGEPVFLLEGRFGPYVQLGPTPEDKKAPKPKRASLPKNKKAEELTIDEEIGRAHV